MVSNKFFKEASPWAIIVLFGALFSVGRATVEVDTRKCDCNREPVHCHIKCNGGRVGQVFLDSPNRDTKFGDLNRSEVNAVHDAIADRRYEIREAYEHNRDYGADY